MLLFDTRKFDIQTYVLDPSDEAPAKLLWSILQRRFDGFWHRLQFWKKVDVLTFDWTR
jgi:5-(carboxyamino)imidazole ribonucleotide synthase